MSGAAVGGGLGLLPQPDILPGGRGLKDYIIMFSTHSNTHSNAFVVPAFFTTDAAVSVLCPVGGGGGGGGGGTFM